MSKSLKSEELEFFNNLSSRDKILVILGDFYKLTHQELYDKTCKSVISVISVSEKKPSNSSNSSNILTSNSLYVILNREIKKEHLFTDKSEGQTKYYLSEKGILEIGKLWNQYLEEVFLLILIS